MPIEVKEIHIKVNVEASKNSSASTATSSTNASGDQSAIVAACVEQVLQILKDKEER
ncbi:MAG: DUF5908 family protein [Bacteroidota bacterium]